MPIVASHRILSFRTSEIHKIHTKIFMHCNLVMRENVKKALIAASMKQRRNHEQQKKKHEIKLNKPNIYRIDIIAFMQHSPVSAFLLYTIFTPKLYRENVDPVRTRFIDLSHSHS